MFLMTPGLRQHITRRVPPTRSLAAPEKPARAGVRRGADVEASKGREPVLGEDTPVRNPRTLHGIAMTGSGSLALQRDFRTLVRIR